MDWNTWYILTAIVVALAMVAGHWFPWRYYTGRDLSRVGAYVYGTSWMVGVPLIICLLLGQVEIAGLFAASATAAGLATLIAHRMDETRERRHRELDEQERLRLHAGK